MKVIIKGKRYDTAKAKLILKVQYPDAKLDKLWLTEKGTWLMESTDNEDEKCSLWLFTSEEAFEFLEDMQYMPFEFFTKGIDSQSIVEIIEKYFPEKVEDE